MSYVPYFMFILTGYLYLKDFYLIVDNCISKISVSELLGFAALEQLVQGGQVLTLLRNVEKEISSDLVSFYYLVKQMLESIPYIILVLHSFRLEN